MAERKSFLLRLPTDLLDQMQRWARDDLRSLNAQIEFVLRDSLRRRGRIGAARDEAGATLHVSNDAAEDPNPQDATQ